MSSVGTCRMTFREVCSRNDRLDHNTAQSGQCTVYTIRTTQCSTVRTISVSMQGYVAHTEALQMARAQLMQPGLVVPFESPIRMRHSSSSGNMNAYKVTFRTRLDWIVQSDVRVTSVHICSNRESIRRVNGIHCVTLHLVYTRQAQLKKRCGRR